MSYNWRFTGAADSDLSECLYHIVALTGGEGLYGHAPEIGALYDSADSRMVGVLQNVPTEAGRAATIACMGISKIVAGAAIAPGAVLTCNSSARAVTVDSGDMACARALYAAAADGEIIEAVLFPPIRWSSIA